MIPAARNSECIAFSNIAATTAGFRVTGGYYNAAVIATFGGGSVKLHLLGPDGSTYAEYDSTNTSFSAAGQHNVYLPQGTYKWVVATATAIYATLTRIPIS